MNIAYIKEKVMRGEEITPSEALSLASDECDLSSLLDATAEVTNHFGSRKFDSCSIINARWAYAPRTANGVPSQPTTPPEPPRIPL